MKTRKALAWFLGIAFGLAWILFLAPLAFGPPGSQARQVATLIFWSLAMWAPGLGALVAARHTSPAGSAGLGLRRLGPRRYYLWAWLAPPVLAAATGLLTWLFGLGALDLSFPLIREAMAAAPGAEGIPAWAVVAAQAGFSLTLAPLVNTALALGEELGWRGFLLPQLLPLGRGRAILLSGLLWGLWHAPAILQGHNYPGRPVLGIFLMMGFTTLLGAFFSWLYLETRSPWAPALAHGAVNAVAGLPLLFLTGVDLTLGGTLASLTGWVPLAALVGWLVWSGRLALRRPAAALTPARP
jgi:membrane protease YdiL (CAAX protease family)